MQTLERSLKRSIRRMMRSGTVGMSMASLKQVTSTRGLSCSVADYHRQFPRVAREVAAKLHFTLY